MKQQIFIDDIHEYDYELIEENRHILYYSNGEQWNSNSKNYVSCSIIDNGNDLRVRFDHDNQFILDYAQAERLFVLLKLAIQPAKYEIGTKKLL